MPLPQRVRIDELALSVSAQMLTKSQAVARIANCTSSRTTLHPVPHTHSGRRSVTAASATVSVIQFQTHTVAKDLHTSISTSTSQQTRQSATALTEQHHITSPDSSQSAQCQFTLRSTQTQQETGRAASVHTAVYANTPGDRPACLSSHCCLHKHTIVIQYKTQTGRRAIRMSASMPTAHHITSHQLQAGSQSDHYVHNVFK